MLVVVSPAKNLDFASSLPAIAASENTQPALLSEVKELVEVCKKLSPADLSSLMKISDKLAILNAERFSSFEFPFTNDNARAAMYAFNGDVYTGLDAGDRLCTWHLYVADPDCAQGARRGDADGLVARRALLGGVYP